MFSLAVSDASSITISSQFSDETEAPVSTRARKTKPVDSSRTSAVAPIVFFPPLRTTAPVATTATSNDR